MAKMTKAIAEKEVEQKQESRAGEIQLPVYYNKGGRKVKASGTRFSPKGCVVLTKRPHDCGTSFTLQITSPQSKKSIQVDSSVILRRHFAARKNWGMVIRFLNLTDGERDEIQQILSDAAGIPESARESRYLNTPIGQTILRYFNLKKLIN
jgi:hypothetical protein